MKHTYILNCLLCAALLSACQPAPVVSSASEATPVAARETYTAEPTQPPMPTFTFIPTEPPMPTFTLIPSETPSPVPPPMSAYEVLSPTRIKAGDYTLDVTVELTANELHFTVYSEFPVAIEKRYPDGDVPPAVKNVDIQIRDCASTLKANGGGGGGGGEGNGMTGRTYGTSYWVDHPLKEGDRYHVTALVTFDNSIGIFQPVLFEYDLVVKKAAGPSMYP